MLPESLRSFVLAENWRREVEKIGERFNLDEEKYAAFENEVFLVLLCFEPMKDLAENIKNELGIDANMIGWMTEDVNKNIFSKVSGELEAIGKQIDANKETNQPQNEVGFASRNEIGVGQSFEQIILNQARAMQPAREAPSNLPTGENNQSEPSKIIHNYGDSDPYREPLQ